MFFGFCVKAYVNSLLKSFDGAVLYMRIIFLGMTANLIFNFVAAVLRAIDDTKIFL